MKGLGGSPCALAALVLLAGACLTTPLHAEPPSPADAEATQKADAERDRRAENLKRVQDALAASTNQRTQFEAEIAAIGSDRSKLDSALLDAGRQAQRPRSG